MNHKIIPHGRRQENKDEGRTNPCKQKGAGPSGGRVMRTSHRVQHQASGAAPTGPGHPGAPTELGVKSFPSSPRSTDLNFWWVAALRSSSAYSDHSHPPKDRSTVWPEKGGFPFLPQDVALGHTWADNNGKGRTDTNNSHENPASGAQPHHSMRPTLFYSLQLNSANMGSNPFHRWGTEARAGRWWSQESNPDVSDAKSPYRQNLYLKLMASFLLNNLQLNWFHSL